MGPGQGQQALPAGLGLGHAGGVVEAGHGEHQLGLAALQGRGQAVRVHALTIHGNRHSLAAQGLDEGQNAHVAGALHHHPVTGHGEGFQGQCEAGLGARQRPDAPAWVDGLALRG